MGPFAQAGAVGQIGSLSTGGRLVIRVVMALMLAMTLLGALAGLSAKDASAGQAGTINTDGVGLMAGFTDQSIIEWMYAGERVDVLWGPEDGKYEVRYYGVDGWVWAEYLTVDGVGGGSVTYDAPAEVAYEEHWIDINRTQGSVTLYIGDTPQATYWASMGWDTSDYGYYSTAVGTYYVNWMDSSLQYTPFADAYITHWIGFDWERSNGFHSYTKDANGDIVPNGAGKTGGCVALAPGDIDAVYNFAFPGMRVEIHN
ncbi:MAG TPA: L,D-transpeptidase family protein [Thermomicrobiales bacterium]|nr:L,D-transpeptidase family protein [Thermomicrobiales bacterium]